MIVGAAFQHRAYQSGFEGLQETHGLQRGFTARCERLRLGVALEQALVFQQGVLDLAIARQRRILVDAKSLGRLSFRLGEIPQSGFGHQAGGFHRQTTAAFAGSGFGVLLGAVHVVFSPELAIDPVSGRVATSFLPCL